MFQVPWEQNFNHAHGLTLRLLTNNKLLFATGSENLSEKCETIPILNIKNDSFLSQKIVTAPFPEAYGSAIPDTPHAN